MNTPLKTEHLEPPLHHTNGADLHESPLDPDEEERAFVREMMKMSRRNTAREIERLYGPIRHRPKP
jgi:hypothetical protein